MYRAEKEDKKKDKRTKNYYYLITIEKGKSETVVIEFPKTAVVKATVSYNEFEMNLKDSCDIVLVSSDSIDELKKTYPNYFEDIKEFVDLMYRFIG